MQHGGASCAKTWVGVVKPRANAMVIPNATVISNVKNPTSIG